MGWAVTALFLLASAPQDVADHILPSRAIDLPDAVVESREPASFDLLDFRDAQRHPPQTPLEVDPRTTFGIKRHIGVAAGYDNQNIHASVGWYLTIAEWGRWNFGVPSPALGFGRYAEYDRALNAVVSKTDYTLVVSLASVHYRAGRIQSLGMNWYVNFEQIFDMRANTMGSQVGISLSRK
jgi:hypothetical protein